MQPEVMDHATPLVSDVRVPLAHVAEDHRLHGLASHLQGTATRCAAFAAEFGCAELGELAGLWHDLGKFSTDFQHYIRSASGLDAHCEGKPGRVDHSTAGGLHAVKAGGPLGRVLAYLIAGHHAGLPDWQGNHAGKAALASRLANQQLLDAIPAGLIPHDIAQRALPRVRPPRQATELTYACWLRMLFSCLVDADFLDTEEFFMSAATSARMGYPSLAALRVLFDRYMHEKQAAVVDSRVNRMRAAVFNQCVARATESPGLFTLTVPTGGGKTLASMAFALQHATAHAQRRIIYVIPYTSIIEQTADQFRAIFGDVVVEHHSNIEVSDAKAETARNRLACENWDAPIIVTTTVQFYESLFAARTSRCRKLHNIANSVVILDEAQLLPPDFLTPILAVLTELQQNYGVTVVFCTATQPALGPQQSVDFQFKGLTGLHEIVEDPANLYRELERTELQVLGNLQDPQSWEAIAQRLGTHDSVLCIVNRRDDARQLWEMMPEGTIHLSALMCGAHRSTVIADIKQRLQRGVPTRVISTQLVEAGVDVDFPVVYRALAGLDSIAQAAGRCNREGKLARGTVYVFTPPSTIPAGYLRQAAEIGRRLLAEAVETPLAPERFDAFFRELYWMRGDRLDKEQILGLLRNDAELHFSFRTAADKFRLIDDTAQIPVIVRYENAALLHQLEHSPPERWLLRKLQRSVVNVPRWMHGHMLASGSLVEVHPGVYVQGPGARYHETLGLVLEKSAVMHRTT